MARLAALIVVLALSGCAGNMANSSPYDRGCAFNYGCPANND